MGTPDLNLLVVFDAVMAERNLRLAAARLGRSQPAVSQAVARLRDLTGDRLFERTPQGVRPTPRAEALWRELREPLDRIARTLTHDGFDPARLERTEVTIGLADDLTETAFAPLVAHLQAKSPGIVPEAVPTDHQTVWQDVRAGTVDLAVTVAPPPPRGLAGRVLYTQAFVVLHRHDVAAPRDAQAYLAAAHVAVGFRAGEPGYVDRRLADMGRERRIVARTPRFAAIPDLVRRTGALATMPEPVARHHAAAHGLAVSPLPLPLDPVAVRLCWHERRRTDPLHVWLRAQVEAVVAAAHRTGPG